MADPTKHRINEILNEAEEPAMLDTFIPTLPTKTKNALKPVADDISHELSILEKSINMDKLETSLKKFFQTFGKILSHITESNVSSMMKDKIIPMVKKFFPKEVVSSIVKIAKLLGNVSMSVASGILIGFAAKLGIESIPEPSLYTLDDGSGTSPLGGFITAVLLVPALIATSLAVGTKGIVNTFREIMGED